MLSGRSASAGIRLCSDVTKNTPWFVNMARRSHSSIKPSMAVPMGNQMSATVAIAATSRTAMKVRLRGPEREETRDCGCSVGAPGRYASSFIDLFLALR